MPDVFTLPWFPFFAQKFIEDTRDLTAEQIGAYLLLLIYQWDEGGVPNDIARLATIARLSIQKARALMTTLGDRFETHPAMPNMLANAFLERVRDEQRAKCQTNSRVASGAAKKRWEIERAKRASSNATSSADGNSSSNAYGTAVGTAASNADIRNRDHLASLGEEEVARARADEALAAARAFCAEALEAAVKAGFVGDRDEQKTWVEANVEAAQRLLKEHGVELTMRRWQQVLDDLKVGHLRNHDDVSLRFLLRLWPKIDARERRQQTGPGKPVVEISEHARSYYDRLEERTGGAA